MGSVSIKKKLDRFWNVVLVETLIKRIYVFIKRSDAHTPSLRSVSMSHSSVANRGIQAIVA